MKWHLYILAVGYTPGFSQQMPPKQHRYRSNSTGRTIIRVATCQPIKVNLVNFESGDSARLPRPLPSRQSKQQQLYSRRHPRNLIFLFPTTQQHPVRPTDPTIDDGMLVFCVGELTAKQIPVVSLPKRPSAQNEFWLRQGGKTGVLQSSSYNRNNN